jgi:hypothetical protein
MTPLDLAVKYISLGWSPIPVRHKSKRPSVDDGWQHLRVTRETAPRYFNGQAQNIGVILGRASGGLTDVDLDCAEAIAAANYLLPRTRSFGRESKRLSHRLYVTNLSDTEDQAVTQFKGQDKAVILEVRTGGGERGAQTVFPDSTHESGEAVTWEDENEPIATIDGQELMRVARRVAAAAILARHFPGPGARHNTGLVLGGFLARCGFNPYDAKLFAEAVVTASHQTLDKRDVVRAVVDALGNHAGGGRSAGMPMLKETFGEGAAKKAAEWLGYRAEASGSRSARARRAPIG